MRTIPVELHYKKTGQEPIKRTQILRVQEWAALYPEYLDSKIFKDPCHLSMISSGWQLVSYEYNPNQ